MARCEDCGCSMSGGFCSNCHEEVFIEAQYSEQGMEVPESIAKKASEQINDKNRIKQANKIRKVEEQKRLKERQEYFGE